MTALLPVLILVLVLGGIGYWAVRFGPLSKSETKAAQKEVYYCPMHPTYTSDRPGDCPICNMKLVRREKAENKKERKILYYRHPMGQPDTSPVPKKDSMGMDYIPVYEDELGESPRVLTVEELLKMKPGEICLLHKCKMGTCLIAMTKEFARLGKCPHCGEDLGIIVKDFLPQGYSAVKLALEKQQLIGIKTAKATRQRLIKTIRTVGTVAHDPELYQAQAEYLQALQAVEKAKQSSYPEIAEQAEQLVASTRIRLKHLGLNEDLIQEIAARKTPEHGLLYAENREPVWVYAQVYEFELPLVHVGQEVLAEVASLPGQTFRGKVRSIDPMVESMTRTTRVRIQVENPEGLLKPDMYLNVSLSVDLGEVLAVPEETVFTTGERNLIFVARSDGTFEPREVVLGAKTDGFSEIKNGLSEGENVVTSGNFLIDSESRLKAALEGADGGGVHQHG